MRYLFMLASLLFSISAVPQNLPLVWQGCFGGSKPDKANDVIEVEDGYLIVGVARSDDGDVSYLHGGDDGWLIKTDFDGNLIWEKTYGGSYGEGFGRIFPSQDGNYYLIGGSSSSDGDITNDPYPGSTDFWIVKIDATGEIIWDRIVGGNMLDQVWTGAITTDGGVVALGWTGSNDGDVSDWFGLYDIWMVKLNSEGEVVADRSLGTSSFDWGVAMVETSDGGFLLGGGSGVGTGGNITCEPYGNDDSDAVFFKLDADLNIEWQSCYGGTDDDVVS
jgi:hypothetical protein